MRRNLFKILRNLEITEHTHISSLVLHLDMKSILQQYHDVVNINETLVSLSTKLLNQRYWTLTKVIHLCLGIDQFTTQTFEHTFL